VEAIGHLRGRSIALSAGKELRQTVSARGVAPTASDTRGSSAENGRGHARRERVGDDMDPLDVVFRHLDRWRHLPNYQLERRADVFFSAYLKGVVEEFTETALEEEIIPEFPIKRDLIWPDLPTSKSVKVDYVLFAKDRSRVFFAELKTDGASRREAQDTYLETAKRLGFRRIVEGLRSIILATTAHQKYHHLAVALARLGHLNLPPDLWNHLYPVPGPRVLAHLDKIEVAPADPPIEVIYIQPEGTDGDRCIDFARFSEYVGRHSDPFSQRFAEHLLRWRAAAGSSEPI
jgi:hypothetical protein